MGSGEMTAGCQLLGARPFPPIQRPDQGIWANPANCKCHMTQPSIPNWGIIFKSQGLGQALIETPPGCLEQTGPTPDQNPVPGLASVFTGACTPRTPPVHVSQGRSGTLPGSDSTEDPSFLPFAATLPPGGAAPCVPATVARAWPGSPLAGKERLLRSRPPGFWIQSLLAQVRSDR